jgi:hypothetical protein
LGWARRSTYLMSFQMASVVSLRSAICSGNTFTSCDTSARCKFMLSQNFVMFLIFTFTMSSSFFSVLSIKSAIWLFVLNSSTSRSSLTSSLISSSVPFKASRLSETDSFTVSWATSFSSCLSTRDSSVRSTSASFSSRMSCSELCSFVCSRDI